MKSTKSLGIYELEVPSTGCTITGEKFETPNGIFFKVGNLTFREYELREVREAPKGIIPPLAEVSWR